MHDLRLNRVLSRPLTRLLLKTPLTPNQVTLLSLACGLAAGYFFSLGRYAASLAGAAGYQLAVVLDNCDGEVARAKNMRSSLGGWLDVLVDILNDLALFTGVALGLRRQGIPGPVWLFLALCLSGAAIHCLLVVLEKVKGFGPAVFESPHPEQGQRRDFWLTLFDALREGEASWFVVLFACAGQTQYLLWAGGVYMQALWIGAALVNFRRVFGGRTA